MDELTEAELRYYNDLFKICTESTDSSGKIPALRATSLFRSANLTNEIINKITSLVGIPQTALHLSRQQFYGCLKLIAAYQASVPLREEILTSTMSLPLPQFSWIDSPTSLPPSVGAVSSSSAAGSGAAAAASSSAISERNGYQHALDMKSGRDLIELITTSSSSSRERMDNISNSGGDVTNSDQPSTDSEVDHNDDSMLRSAERHHVITVKGQGGGKLVGGGRTSGGVGGSPEAWSTASDSPTPTNSVAERPWANQANLWQGLVCEEQRQLLGTEEESSDKHSSDDEQDIDLEFFYQISPTQKEYYLKQFRTIQPDIHGLVSGPVARVFFEKSRIPIEELRHIWQTCDVTRDGALNLSEFTAAMHLVVLRRNNIPLPTTLPPCLMPTLLQHTLYSGLLQNQHSGGSTSSAKAAVEMGNNVLERTGPAEADLLHLESDDNTDSGHQTVNSNAKEKLVTVGSSDSPPTISSTTGAMKLNNTASGRKTPTNLGSPHHHQQMSKHTGEHPITPPNTLSNKQDWNTSSKEWTKFTESPTSNVSSPGPKPVNFDMQRTTQAIESNPQILHPVPLRVTPVGAEAADNGSLVYSVAVDAGGMLIVQRDDGSPKQQQQQQQQHHQQQQHSVQRDSLTSNDLRAIQRPQPKKPPSKGFGAIPPPPQRESSISSTTGADVVMTTSLDPATFSTVVNSTSTVAHPGTTTVNSTAAAATTGKKDQPPPPLPPPRPNQHRHTRSSSLDLNKLKLSNASAGGLTKQLDDASRMPPPPEVPPRVTPTADQHPGHGFADFTHFPSGAQMTTGENNVTTIHLDASGNMTHHSSSSTRSSLSNSLIPGGPPSLQTAPRNSAFEVYRKPQQHLRGSQSPPQPPPPLMASRSVESTSLEYEKRIMTLSDNLRQVRFKNSEATATGPEALKHLKEQNLLLLRICSDLSEELLQIQQKREDIRIKIELQEQNLGAGATASGGPPSNHLV